MGFPGGSAVNNSPANAGDMSSIFPSLEDPLEKEMATHSSILIWEIPWTEEPGKLHSPWGCMSSIWQWLNKKGNIMNTDALVDAFPKVIS